MANNELKLEALRVAFEDHVMAKYGDKAGPEYKRNSMGRYVYAHVQNDWEIWQKAATCRTTLAQAEPSGALPRPREARTSDPRDQAHAAGWNACLEAVAAILGQQGGGDAASKLAHGHRGDYYLMANARRVAILPIHKVVRMTNANFASELFATGSTSGHRICVDAGVAPDGYTVERAAIQAQAGDATNGGA